MQFGGSCAAEQERERGEIFPQKKAQKNLPQVTELHRHHNFRAPNQVAISSNSESRLLTKPRGRWNNRWKIIASCNSVCRCWSRSIRRVLTTDFTPSLTVPVWQFPSWILNSSSREFHDFFRYHLEVALFESATAKNDDEVIKRISSLSQFISYG